MSDRPLEPGPVDVYFKDGSSMGMEVYYIGFQDGAHVWATTGAVVEDDVDHVSFGVLPAHTMVTVTTKPAAH